MPVSLKKPVISFIGAGNMAQSIIRGLLAKDYQAQQITIAEPNAVKIDNLQKEFAIYGTIDNCQAVQHAEIIILAVKPQQLSIVCKEIAPILAQQNSLIISVAAGASMEFLNKLLGANTAIVRCMPNTPALIGRGAAGLFANRHVSTLQKQWAEGILNAVGMSVWVEDESKIDIITALSGSGPAYFFYFIESLQKAAEKLGLDAETARSLSLQTALGAVCLANESEEDLSTLRQRVTSPGGTTEQGVNALANGDLPKLCLKTLEAAQTRAHELAEQLLKEIASL